MHFRMELLKKVFFRISDVIATIRLLTAVELPNGQQQLPMVIVSDTFTHPPILAQLKPPTRSAMNLSSTAKDI
jgi:hypothetical protein